MSRRERLLLILLGIVCVGAFFYFSISSSVAAIRDCRTSVARYNDAVSKLSSEEGARRTKEPAKTAVSEIPITDVAALVLKQLAAAGITPERYTVTGKEKNATVSFIFLCTPTQLQRYLYGEKAGQRPYTVKSLTISLNRQGVEVTLKASAQPCIMVKTCDTLSAYEFERFISYREKQTKTAPTAKLPVQQKEPSVPVNATGLYKVIGRIREVDGKDYLYLKKKDGTLCRIPSENIEEETEKTIRFLFEGCEYEIYQ